MEYKQKNITMDQLNCPQSVKECHKQLSTYDSVLQTRSSKYFIFVYQNFKKLLFSLKQLHFSLVHQTKN